MRELVIFLSLYLLYLIGSHRLGIGKSGLITLELWPTQCRPTDGREQHRLLTMTSSTGAQSLSRPRQRLCQSKRTQPRQASGGGGDA